MSYDIMCIKYYFLQKIYYIYLKKMTTNSDSVCYTHFLELLLKIQRNKIHIVISNYSYI